MSASHDRKFFDTFMLILGVLAAVTIGLMVLSGVINRNTAAKYHQEDPLRQQETLARIAPVAKVAVAGKDNTALAAPTEAPAAALVDLPGEQVYSRSVRLPCRRRGGRTQDGRPGQLGSTDRAGRRYAEQARDRGIPGQGRTTCRRRVVAPTSATSRSLNAVEYMVSQVK